MIKKFLISCLFASNVAAMDFNKTQLSQSDIHTISAAIYRIEGGSNTKYPYGIRSIDTHNNLNKSRLICENTIKNNYARWIKAGRKQNYLDFLADIYCPKSCDLQGNINWHKNINSLIK